MKNLTHKNYVRKFSDKFYPKHIRKSADGTLKLVGKYGEIGPYDHNKGRLGLWYMDSDKHSTNTRRKRMILKPLDDNEVSYTIHQEGETEFGLIFHETDLNKVCEIIKITRKKELSPEERVEKIKNLGKANKARKSSYKGRFFAPRLVENAPRIDNPIPEEKNRNDDDKSPDFPKGVDKS